MGLKPRQTRKGKESAASAELALQYYGGIVKGDDDDDATLITDLLADLMHLCRRDGFDFDSCLGSARMHLEHEG